ncbi:MAG: hypothetical protein IPI95_13535 [Flavobacteriales bacterium]|nr:hypothetical protein [Flavobacteriales bacterium]
MCFFSSQYPGRTTAYHTHTIGREPFVAAGIPVVPVEVMHYHMPVLGFRIGRLTYITDAKSISPEEKRKIREARVLVVNALRKKERISHFNWQEALALIGVGPGRAHLTRTSTISWASCGGGIAATKHTAQMD